MNHVQMFLFWHPVVNHPDTTLFALSGLTPANFPQPSSTSDDSTH